MLGLQYATDMVCCNALLYDVLLYLDRLRTGKWSWSEPAAVEEALSGIPAVPALLYKSSRWEKMFENYLKLVHKPGSEHGWGCAAGGKR